MEKLEIEHKPPCSTFLLLSKEDLARIKIELEKHIASGIRKLHFTYNNRVIIFSAESCSETKCDKVDHHIFAIESNPFDWGNETAISRAEELFFTGEGETLELKSKRKVAVKIINKKKVGYGPSQDFVREKRMLEKLNRLRGYYESDDFKYMFNEFFDGYNLEYLLTTNPKYKLREEIALAVILEVFKLHQQNILHNDLKSGNIIIKEEGKSVKAALVDFGQACTADDPIAYTTGTAGYICPDHLSGYPTTVLSNFFALGVIIFEIIFASEGTNYQTFILDQKAKSNPFNLKYKHLEAAFPEIISNHIDKSSVRYKLITLAKHLTLPTKTRANKTYLENWLKEQNIDITENAHVSPCSHIEKIEVKKNTESPNKNRKTKSFFLEALTTSPGPKKDLNSDNPRKSGSFSKFPTKEKKDKSKNLSSKKIMDS